MRIAARKRCNVPNLSSNHAGQETDWQFQVLRRILTPGLRKTDFLSPLRGSARANLAHAGAVMYMIFATACIQKSCQIDS